MAAASQPPAGQPAPMPADIAKQEQPASVAHVSSAREEPRIKPAKASGLNRNTIFYAVTAVLVVALIALGVFYGQGVGKLNKANTHVTELTANVTSLEGQLTAAQASVTDLQTQLDAEKATAADLQTQLTAAKGQVTSLTSDLATANGKVTSLTSDLSTANTKVTSLTSDLTIANGKVATIQASLDKANADLAAALVTNTTQAATLRTVQDPRHFTSYAELANFLAQDDTNTNPAYSALQPSNKAYILQIKALRAGFLLPASIWWDSTGIYSQNLAIVGATIYEVYAPTDAIYYGTTFSYTPALHPLPLP
ncbi:MAG: hypothetical protein ABSD79_00885 [Dehalococcoidales bacterium]